jgi:UDP-N-acetylmuramoylalanine--D-glutamate ligase
MVNYKNKKVLVMGLGLHGGALAVVQWLLKHGAQVTITDTKDAKYLKATLDKIKKFPGSKKIQYTLGGHSEADFVNQDLIIQNPGVPQDSSYLKIAKKNKIPITNEAVLFFQMFQWPIIAVTGTRGKSTTASVLEDIVKKQYKKSVLAGNIAKTAMMSVVDHLPKNSWPVLELSSWQLEGLEQYQTSPHIAVVTNVMIDHLNRYRAFSDYRAAKFSICKYQKPNDVVVLNADNVHTKAFAKKVKSQVYYFSLNKKVKGAYLKQDNIYFFASKKNELVMNIANIKVLGQHNLANILAAVCVAKILNIDNKKISSAVNNFPGIEYRLQLIKNMAGLKIYNDSTSTTPDATVAALRALANEKIVLLAGGVDKQLEYPELARVIKKQVESVVLLRGNASDKLLHELKKVAYPKDKIHSELSSLKQGWSIARAEAKKNKATVILFSPAAASFNMFKNEFDRAKQFNNIVNKVHGKKSKI